MLFPLNNFCCYTPSTPYPPLTLVTHSALCSYIQSSRLLKTMDRHMDFLCGRSSFSKNSCLLLDLGRHTRFAYFCISSGPPNSAPHLWGAAFAMLAPSPFSPLLPMRAEASGVRIMCCSLTVSYLIQVYLSTRLARAKSSNALHLASGSAIVQTYMLGHHCCRALLCATTRHDVCLNMSMHARKGPSSVGCSWPSMQGRSNTSFPTTALLRRALFEVRNGALTRPPFQRCSLRA